MSATQVHLMLNHVPVLGTVFAAITLGVGLLLRERALLRFGLVVLVAVAVIAVPVLLTGSSAENRIEHLPGVSSGAIDAHEDAARAVTWALGALGLLALGGLLWARRTGPSVRTAATLLVLTLGLCGWVAWAAHLGGLIRHPELRAAQSAAGAQPSSTSEGDDDRD